jgi:hypothetical protein
VSAAERRAHGCSFERSQERLLQVLRAESFEPLAQNDFEVLVINGGVSVFWSLKISSLRSQAGVYYQPSKFVSGTNDLIYINFFWFIKRSP